LLKKLLLGLAFAALAAAGFAWWSAEQREAPSASAYFTDNDRMIEVAGAKVRIRMEGPEEAPPVILMHGFIYSLETWDGWAEALKSDYRVIRFDLLGHGLSGPDPQRRYSPQERADFVGDVMDALQIERAIVGGNSLGGLAAWRFAAGSPERVKALILVSPGGYPINGVGDEPVPAPPPMALFLRTAPDAGVAATLRNIYGDDSLVTAERIRLVADMMRQNGNGEAFVQSIGEFTAPDPEAALNSIEAPTLILWGAKDSIIPLDHGRRMEAAMPNATLIVYEGVGHAAQEEAPDATAADARAFLASLREDE